MSYGKKSEHIEWETVSSDQNSGDLALPTHEPELIFEPGQIYSMHLLRFQYTSGHAVTIQTTASAPPKTSHLRVNYLILSGPQWSPPITFKTQRWDDGTPIVTYGMWYQDVYNLTSRCQEKLITSNLPTFPTGSGQGIYYKLNEDGTESPVEATKKG